MNSRIDAVDAASNPTESAPKSPAARNVRASAVRTTAWLAGLEREIVVPVYQRQYRWDIWACERLLDDVRAAADAGAGQTHFIGSILSATTIGTSGTDAEGSAATNDELILIDGQQRITTIMLLAAALHHGLRSEYPEVAAEIERLLVLPDAAGTAPMSTHPKTKLRPHRAWAGVYTAVVLDEAQDDAADSRFDDNYAFFRSQIGDDALRIWEGLTRLEHVAITLGADANAQQTFESLNSTGEPLRDHELIHNYVLMGLSHAEQTRIEQEFWLPIEQNTGELIAAFWRHYLVLQTGREIFIGPGREVYDAFRARFPRLDPAELRAAAAAWREASIVFATLLDPSRESDADVARHLAHINTFGRVAYPLVMSLYGDYRQGRLSHEELIAALEQVQTLLLRRAVVGLPIEHIVARLCRARAEGADALQYAISRITPSDERVRVALKYGALPHAEYVLGRLAGVETLQQFAVDAIAPAAPRDDWSPGDGRAFADLSDDEQNSYRALAASLGNLALVEDELAERAFDRSFDAKREIYRRSSIADTAEIAATDAWTTAAIAARTAALTERFVALWRRGRVTMIDDDGLTPILDAKPRRGWPHGWQREFAYVEYRGEHWEVPDVKYLFNRVFRRLWADDRAAVIAYNARHGGPIFERMSWRGAWDDIDATHHIYMGWDSTYMLHAVQGVLTEAGIAAEVFVKYSYIGDAMR